MKSFIALSLRSGNHGVTLLDFLIGSVLTIAITAGAMQQYWALARYSYDHKIRIATVLQAQAILQNIGSEIRVLGNGVPFDQPLFDIGELSLSDPTVTYPIIISNTTENRISFRLNESGDVFILTQPFDTTTGATTLTLTDSASLDVNDPIYISNSVVAEHDGLFGVIQAVNHSINTVTLAPSYVASPNAIFATGSILEETPVVTYNSPSDGSGITRDSGFGPVLLGEGSTMTLDYLDDSGASITLPLTEESMRDSLRAIKVTISLENPKRLTDGNLYTASVEQTFAVRNLQLVY